MTVKTYPEMNDKIVSILEISDEPTQRYAAQRIRELQAAVAIMDDMATQKNDLVGEVERLRKEIGEAAEIMSRYPDLSGIQFARECDKWLERNR